MVKEEVELYNYQKDATDFVLDNIDETHVLLAAAPNAGKTFMASFIIKELIKNGARVLCSVHGTNVLKRQFYESICNIVGIENVSIYDTSDLSLYNQQKPVQVMIYQNTKQMEECVEEYGEFDYLVVDEAHKFYDGTDSMEIIGAEFVSGNHLLLTGSPAIFKERVDSGEIRAKYISASLIESVHDGQYDKEIRLDVVSNDVHLTIDDYNQNGEVTEKSQNKLVNNEPVLDSLLVDDFGKTIIFVKRTRQADIIETYLNNRGIINYTSHSNSDKDSKNIDEFKNNYTGVDNVVLIVVGRATEGFDDPNVSIIDMTYSKNIDTLYQRYSRAIRKRTDAKDKRYVKVVPNNGNSAEVFIHIMTAVLMLLKQEHYENFNGKNFSIPTLKQEVKKPASGVGAVRSYVPKPKHETNDITDNSIVIKSKEKPQSVKDLVENSNFVVNVTVDDNVYEIKTEDYNEWVNKLEGKEYTITIEKSNDRVDDCLLMETRMYSGSFFDVKDELYGYITRYATSNLQDVLREINSDYLSPEQHFNVCVENKLISDGRYQKFRNENNLKLNSNPQNYFNVSNGEFFKMVREKLGIKNQYEYDVDTIEECVNIGLKLKIKSSRNWRDRHDEIMKITQLKLPNSPWKTFSLDGGSQEFSSLLGWDNSYGVESIDEIIDLCKKYDIDSPNKWVVNYKKISEDEDIRLMVHPWEVFNIDKEEFSKMLGWSYDVDTIEECVLIGKKYNIRNSSNWSDEYKNISESEKIKLPSRPWEFFNIDGGWSEFSRLLGCDETKLSSEEHFKICVENRLVSVPKYQEFIKKNQNLGLYKTIWVFDGKSAKEYFEDVKKHLGVNFLSIEDTFNFCIDNNVIDGSIYKEFRYKNKNLHSRPWKLVNKSQLEYFEEIKNKLGLNTENISIEETYKICLENKLTTGVKYKKYVDDNTQLNLYKAPWSAVGIKQIEFFNKIKKMLGIGTDYLSIEETFNLCVENKLIHSRLYYEYRKKNPQIKTLNEPWAKIGKTMVEFFDEVKTVLGFNKLTYDETVEICVKNGLISGPLYFKFIEKNPEINFFITPWTIKNIKQKEFFKIIKELINIKNSKEREYKPVYLGKFSELNKKWNTSNSKTTHQKLKKDKTEWVKYHELYSNARKNWDEIPYVEIGKIIKNRPEWVVGDFGCGENLLSKEITNKVHAFDHVAIDENVTSCDLTNVPLNDGVLDVVVFSLSLMGTNYKEYFKESYRTLKPMGLVIIAEPSNRWEGRDDEMKELLEEVGFKVSGDIKHTERFIYVTAIKM